MCLEGHKETKKHNESSTYRRVRSFTHSFLFMQKYSLLFCVEESASVSFLFRGNVKFLLFLYLHVQ